jgi:hypothetical protein
MHLVQILLPLYETGEKRIERSAFDNVAQELNERFGGVTLYARAPATGLWKEEAGRTTRDDIVVCEVMVETLDVQWWESYRRGLEQTFAQQELVVRSQEMRRL